MSRNKTTTSVNKLQSKQPLKPVGNVKHFYQFFTFNLIAIFLTVVVGLSSILFFLTLQHNHSQIKITEQLLSVQVQFLQQTYLLKADKLIYGILKSVNSRELLTLQQALSLQSKKLSLLKSAHKNSYQQSFSRNNLAMDLITRIDLNHANNELLKSKSLIQLDTLLDAIEIQLNNQQTVIEQAALLSKVENQLTNIVVVLKDLNLKTSLVTFEKLNKKIDEIFVTDYARQLANLQDESQGMADIVRDFIRFEDLVLKEGLLAKWQVNLHLIDDYQKQLIAEQQQLQSIFSELFGSQHEADSALAISDYAVINKETIVFKQLPKWVVISFAVVLICVVGLLWLVRKKIKTLSQLSVESMSRVIKDTPSSLISGEKGSFSQFYNQAVYGAKPEHLIKKIEPINYSKAEYLALIDKNQMLEEKIIKCNASVKSASQLLLEQQDCEALHLSAIKQLVLIGSSIVTTTKEATNKEGTGEVENYLYHAHLQGRDLVRKLRQTSSYRYLQKSDALLTLNDVNLVALIQATVLNLRNELFLFKNTLSLSIDEKILPEVSLDAELFCETFSAFVGMQLAQQEGKQLALKLRLVDKNKGQQIIRFTGQVECGENTVQPPHALQAFSDDSLEHGELGNYFNALLQLQHGDDVSTKLTDKAYYFSFTLPLAVANNQQEHHFPVLSLPGNLVDIENDCAKLAAKYLVMPIEVLIAVKAPEKYQCLQRLLQGMGLQVTFVSCELMLQQYWQSGRFAILMTEIDCQPFTAFMVDEGGVPSARIALTRGVFSLSSLINITTKSEDYSHWILGRLTAKSTVSELVVAMKPWIKEQDCGSFASEEKVNEVTTSSCGVDAVAEDQFVFTSLNQENSFNFGRYLKHQGSAELAIFMLEEYTTENILLINELSQAVADHDGKKADDVIQALLVNARILAAENLLQLCQQWQTLLTTHGLDSCEKLQMVLLSKTKQAIDEISQHAVTIT